MAKVKWRPEDCTYEKVLKRMRKFFPQGCCATKVIPDKRRKPPKYKLRGDEL